MKNPLPVLVASAAALVTLLGSVCLSLGPAGATGTEPARLPVRAAAGLATLEKTEPAKHRPATTKPATTKPAETGRGHTTTSGHGSTLVIGSTAYPEQQIVAYAYADALRRAGFHVRVNADLGTRADVVPALEHGTIDIEPDYAGSLLDYLNGNRVTLLANNLRRAVPQLVERLKAHHATVLHPAPAIDTNVFAVTRATAAKDHLHDLSDLKPYAGHMVLGGPSDCPTFAECEPGLERVYGLHFASFEATDVDGPLSVAALKSGQVQVVELFSSDGTVVQNHFVALLDNKHLQPAQNLIPVVRKAVDTRKVAKILDALSAKLTTVQLSLMNLENTKGQQSPAVVAQRWVVTEHLG